MQTIKSQSFEFDDLFMMVLKHISFKVTLQRPFTNEKEYANCITLDYVYYEPMSF